MDRPEELEFAWLMFTGILLMFLLSMSVVIFFVYYQRRLHRQQTAMDRLKLEDQKKQLQAEIAAQEKERERIARDLHDEVGALLSTAKLYLTFQHPKAEHHTGSTPSHPAEEMLDEAVLKLRSIAQNLLPENLRLFGLISAIEHNIRQIEKAEAFTVYFTHQLSERLPGDAEIHLYRIVQELFNNALKHAKASQVSLSLSRQTNSVVLTYTDNGVGFTPGKSRNGISLGLTTLSSRVQLLQGEMELESAPGKGVKIIITCPVHT